MYIHNPYSRTAYRFLTAVFLLWGILLHFSCVDGDKTAHNFSFFTVQSNLLCLICFLLLLKQDIRVLRRKKYPQSCTVPIPHSGSDICDGDPDQTPRTSNALTELKFAATLCILVTFFCNHAVVLFGRAYTGGVLGLPMKSFLAHYVSPLLVTLDWLLFTPKGRLQAYSPLIWMFAPALYLLSTALRALCCSEDVLARTGKYPYFFLNVNRVGVRVYIYIGIYFAVFLAVGYLICFADRVFSKLPFPLRGHRHG